MMTNALGVTGHRPNKLGGYSDQVASRLRDLAGAVIEHHQPELVISGMALGWDTAMAEASVQTGVQLIAHVPFPGQARIWSKEFQKKYESLLSRSEVIYTHDANPSDRREAAKMLQDRNAAMADHLMALRQGDSFVLVAALWNGTRGGTGNYVQLAEKLQLPVANYWHSWMKYR